MMTRDMCAGAVSHVPILARARALACSHHVTPCVNVVKVSTRSRERVSSRHAITRVSAFSIMLMSGIYFVFDAPDAVVAIDALATRVRACVRTCRRQPVHGKVPSADQRALAFVRTQARQWLYFQPGSIESKLDKLRLC